MTWYDLIWRDLTWDDLRWLEMTWYNVRWLEMTWDDLIWFKITWDDLIRLDMIKDYLRWLEMTWHDLIRIHEDPWHLWSYRPPGRCSPRIASLSYPPGGTILYVNRSSHLGINKQTNAFWSIPRSQTVFHHFKICRRWELWSLCFGALLPAFINNWSNVLVQGDTKLNLDNLGREGFG